MEKKKKNFVCKKEDSLKTINPKLIYEKYWSFILEEDVSGKKDIQYDMRWIDDDIKNWIRVRVIKLSLLKKEKQRKEGPKKLEKKSIYNFNNVKRTLKIMNGESIKKSNLKKKLQNTLASQKTQTGRPSASYANAVLLSRQLFSSAGKALISLSVSKRCVLCYRCRISVLFMWWREKPTVQLVCISEFKGVIAGDLIIMANRRGRRRVIDIYSFDGLLLSLSLTVFIIIVSSMNINAIPLL